MYRLVTLYYIIGLIYCFHFFSFFFLSAILIGWFSLFYFPDHLFILLHYIVYYSWPLTHLDLSK